MNVETSGLRVRYGAHEHETRPIHFRNVPQIKLLMEHVWRGFSRVLEQLAARTCNIRRLDLMSIGLRFALAACSINCSACLHAQTGPLVGYTPGQGVMVGWEGGAGAVIAGAALGAEVRPFGEALTKFYLAYEPAFAVPVHENSSTRTEYLASSGGTGGIAIDEHGAVAPLLGAWLGGVSLQGGDCHERWAQTFSISVGFHMFLDRPERQWTVYATPKLGTVGECLHIGFPSQ